MKKIVFMISLLAITASSAMAQYKFDPMVWTMEVLFNPVASYNSSVISLPAYGAKVRLFIIEACCLRIPLVLDNLNVT